MILLSEMITISMHTLFFNFSILNLIGTISCIPTKKNKIKNKYRTFSFKTKLRSWEFTETIFPYVPLEAFKGIATNCNYRSEAILLVGYIYWSRDAMSRKLQQIQMRLIVKHILEIYFMKLWKIWENSLL